MMEKKKSFRYIIDSGIGCSFVILAPFVGILGLAALVSSYKVVPRAFNGDLKCIILLWYIHTNTEGVLWN